LGDYPKQLDRLPATVKGVEMRLFKAGVTVDLDLESHLDGSAAKSEGLWMLNKLVVRFFTLWVL
jgi:hypothetical protein